MRQLINRNTMSQEVTIYSEPKWNLDRIIRTLSVNGREYKYYSLYAAEALGSFTLARLPYSLKVLFENLLRNYYLTDAISADDVSSLGSWTEKRHGGADIAFHPSRVIMPESSGVPLLADLASMRDAIATSGGNPGRVNPQVRADVIVDHSVIVDVAGQPDALSRNLEIEYDRNRERYEFLRWAQHAFSNLRVMPTGNGIIHQVNIEFLADVVSIAETSDGTVVYPDTLVGTDSHTPMVNALGVLGWGCGGIEASAALLGQPISASIPEVIGVRFVGALREGVTATDLVLTVTERLRQYGVVQKFVEYFGPGLFSLSMPARATIANMAPEYGATVGFFPIDHNTLDYLRATGRDNDRVQLVEAYAKEQGLWHDGASVEPLFTDVIEIDLGAIEQSIAGPRRPQDRLALSEAPASFSKALIELTGQGSPSARAPVRNADFALEHGYVVLAAITSCTNTSNPHVIIGAALLARNAARLGLTSKPWVKTSFSPGSRVVGEYLDKSGLQQALDALGFHVTGFGCMTCMGNSGPLSPDIADAIDSENLAVVAVLSGNRNFEGRIHPKCRMNYLASPPLVVAYALAGRMTIDFEKEELGYDGSGRPVFLRDIWPGSAEIDAVIQANISPELYRERYSAAYVDEKWQGLQVRGGDTFAWTEGSDYIKHPPFLHAIKPEILAPEEINGARALAVFGDSITTDHISPIGVIAKTSPAGRYLLEQRIAERDFNSYGSRRVNHEVMVRGTFANPRLRNEMAPGKEGGYTRHMPSGELMTIYDAAVKYREEGRPLVIIAGSDYGVGSSRDWAAKGTRLLGVRAVIAEGFERIHRSNLIGMAVIPLQFLKGEGRKTHKLDGSEIYDIESMGSNFVPGQRLACTVTRADGTTDTIELLSRIDTAYEFEYLQNGGILPFMLRRLLHRA